jgi:N6-L-threonylcarbamoyladenine synthase
VLRAGGVASSALLKALVPERLRRLNGAIRLHWARPELSGDNAAGVALIGCDHLKEGCA